MKKISLKGIILGSITDIVATNLTAIPLAIYATAAHSLAGVPKEQASHVLMAAMRDDPLIYPLQIGLGALCSILGGYVAARVAKHHELLNGALAAFLCVGSTLYMLLFGTASSPIWQILLELAASPALSALGGYLRLRTTKRAIAI